jgi:hypothetical protein
MSCLLCVVSGLLCGVHLQGPGAYDLAALTLQTTAALKVPQPNGTSSFLDSSLRSSLLKYEDAKAAAALASATPGKLLADRIRMHALSRCVSLVGVQVAA